VLATVASASAQTPQRQTAAHAAAAPPERLTVKVFELKRVDPEEARQALIVVSSLGSNSQTANANPAQARTGLLIAFDASSRTVFVRGTTAQLNAAAELIAALNEEPGKNASSKTVRVLSLRHAAPEQAIAILTSLGWQNNVVALKKSRLLIVRADADAEDVGTVVQKLDQASKNDKLPTSRAQTNARTPQRPTDGGD
jgi:hypothetical protein